MKCRENFEEICSWVNTTLKSNNIQVTELNGDASLRTYYRVKADNKSYVLMDSRNDPSFNRFILINEKLEECEINVPKNYC